MIISSNAAHNNNEKLNTLLKKFTSNGWDFEAVRCNNIAFLLIKASSIESYRILHAC